MFTFNARGKFLFFFFNDAPFVIYSVEKHCSEALPRDTENAVDVAPHRYFAILCDFVVFS